MFKLPNPGEAQSYLEKVTVEIREDNGKVTKHIFKMRFVRKTQEEFDELVSQAREGTLKDRDMLHDVSIGWEDVSDHNGNPLEFNEQNLDAMLNVHPTRPTLVQAYLNSMKGAPRKN